MFLIIVLNIVVYISFYFHIRCLDYYIWYWILILDFGLLYCVLDCYIEYFYIVIFILQTIVKVVAICVAKYYKSRTKIGLQKMFQKLLQIITNYVTVLFVMSN